MRVIAKPGERCPMENKPRQYITDATAVDVPDSTYYRRLAREGSLLKVSEQKQSGKAKGGKE